MQKIIKWHNQQYELDPIGGKLDQIDDDEERPQTFDEIMAEEDAQIQSLVNTPFGLWRVDDAMNPFRQFKFWMGHTNFSLTDDCEEVLKRLPGVEVCKIVTRYRFIIAVAECFAFGDDKNKSFDCRNVRTTIERALCQ